MFTVSVSGAESVARGLGTLAGRLADLSPAFRDLGTRMVDTAVPVTPVASGALVRSLTAVEGPQGGGIRSTLPYAGVQSYGWPARNITAHGFIQAAGELADREGPDALEDLLTTTARRAGLTP